MRVELRCLICVVSDPSLSVHFFPLPHLSPCLFYRIAEFMQKAGAVAAAVLYWQFATSLYPGGIQASDSDGHMLKVRKGFVIFVCDTMR